MKNRDEEKPMEIDERKLRIVMKTAFVLLIALFFIPSALANSCATLGFSAIYSFFI